MDNTNTTTPDALPLTVQLVIRDHPGDGIEVYAYATGERFMRAPQRIGVRALCETIGFTVYHALTEDTGFERSEHDHETDGAWMAEQLRVARRALGLAPDAEDGAPEWAPRCASCDGDMSSEALAAGDLCSSCFEGGER